MNKIPTLHSNFISFDKHESVINFKKRRNLFELKFLSTASTLQLFQTYEQEKHYAL